ncbi:DUF4185 domain-containing protein [Nocardioides conyzicola]|uniref:DUF4185 domain-containing protein n=1 Tax=Nocardioides conyzicola TaxID=1651781 RepID=A0ABP8WPG9_9ACTN
MQPNEPFRASTGTLDGLARLPMSAPAAIADCVHTGRVASLEDLNRISGHERGDDSFQGGDVGAVVDLQDGRRLMVFGDTLRGEGFAGQQFVRNSMLVLSPDCIESVLPADGGAVIPDREGADEFPVGYWPMSLRRVERPGFDLVTLMAQRVQTTGSGVWDFHTLGPSVAVFVVERGETPQLMTVRDLGPDLDDVGSPEWGAATADDGGWLYLYGTARPDEPGVSGFSLRVARVRPDHLLDRRRWCYWTGSRWHEDPSKATDLITAARGVSQTLSVFKQGPTWYALSKRSDFVGSDLVVWIADNPWGPFDDGTTVGQLPSNAVTGELTYMPLAHPELFPEEGTVVVSYSRNCSDVGAVIADPYAYRPRFLRIKLP